MMLIAESQVYNQRQGLATGFAVRVRLWQTGPARYRLLIDGEGIGRLSGQSKTFAQLETSSLDEARACYGDWESCAQSLSLRQGQLIQPVSLY